MSDSAMRTITPDYKLSSCADLLAMVLGRDIHAAPVLICRNKLRLVLNVAAFATQRIEQQPFGHILRHHRYEGVRALIRLELNVGELAVTSHDGNVGDSIRLFEERLDNSSHVEDFECPRKDC